MSWVGSKDRTFCKSLLEIRVTSIFRGTVGCPQLNRKQANRQKKVAASERELGFFSKCIKNNYFRTVMGLKQGYVVGFSAIYFACLFRDTDFDQLFYFPEIG